MEMEAPIKAKELALDCLHREGVYVFRQMMDQQALQIIQQEVSHIRQVVLNKIQAMPRPLKTYSDIAEREPGRLDYRLGFTSQQFHDIVKPIIRIINSASPQIDFRYYWGVIPSMSGSGPTPMHRDVYPILNTTQGDNLDQLDLVLPPYYFTVLLPLVNITEENGPTRFIKGSHRHPIIDVSRSTLYSPLTTPGDVVIFDGRIMHQGSANHSDEERVVAYITFVANWYHDQTFMINEYLFPALAMPGR